MRKIIRNLHKALSYEKSGRKISEIDTQVILVEPMLSLAGHHTNNPSSVKRSSRSSKGGEFDIEVYRNAKLKIAVEVKSLSSNEYNINNSNVGELFEFCAEYKDTGKGKKTIELKWPDTGSASICKYHADCKNYSGNNQCKNAKKKIGNYPSDGVGQLRAYCLNFTNFIKNMTMAVLTNGEEWVIFSSDFTDNPFLSIQDKQVMSKAKITDEDFYKSIINKLK